MYEWRESPGRGIRGPPILFLSGALNPPKYSMYIYIYIYIYIHLVYFAELICVRFVGFRREIQMSNLVAICFKTISWLGPVRNTPALHMSFPHCLHSYHDSFILSHQSPLPQLPLPHSPPPSSPTTPFPQALLPQFPEGPVKRPLPPSPPHSLAQLPKHVPGQVRFRVRFCVRFSVV